MAMLPVKTHLTTQEYRLLSQLATKQKVGVSDFIRGIIVDVICEEGFVIKKVAVPAEQEIIDKYIAGWKRAFIAKHFDVDRQHVYYVLRKHNARRSRELANARRFGPENCSALGETGQVEGANPS